MQLYDQKCEAPKEAGMKQGLISGAGFGVSFALLFCVYAVSFYAGAQLVAHGKTTFTKVFRVSIEFLELSISMFFLANIIPYFTFINVHNCRCFLHLPWQQ